MNEITLTIKNWSNDELKKFNKKDYRKCDKDIVEELALLISQYGDDNLSKNDYKWMLLENLSEKHILNSVHMIMLFNHEHFEDFFEYAEEYLNKLYQELKAVILEDNNK